MKLKQGTRALVVAAALTTPLVFSACEDDITQAEVEETLLLSVVPQGGAMEVDQNGLIVIDFSNSMMEGMEQYADVHEGHVEGMLVPGNWTWNEGRTKMTFTPDAPLKPLTQYVVHIGGGMQDQTGQHINLGQHGLGAQNGGMGGQWMTQQMHQGGNHGNGTGMGGMGMGTNWSHPTNGGYGMTFTFTSGGSPLLLSVVPQGGATDVDPNDPIVLDFSHSMMEGMEQYADVHEDHVEGTLVPGSWSWNEGRTKMTFTPDAPLKSLTQYVVHIGGGMQDQTGHHINFEEHGFGTENGGMGGQWMTQDMHQGGNHGNGTGMGGMGMGTGWNHPTNGGYGMTFTFTTG